MNGMDSFCWDQDGSHPLILSLRLQTRAPGIKKVCLANPLLCRPAVAEMRLVKRYQARRAGQGSLSPACPFRGLHEAL